MVRFTEENLKNREFRPFEICYNKENKTKRFIMTKLYGSLEAGGTKFVCAVGDENFNVVEKHNFQQQLQSKQSIKPLSSSQNSIILLVLQLVPLVPLISIKTQNLWFYHNDSKTTLGKCGLAWCPSSRPSTCQCISLQT